MNNKEIYYSQNPDDEDSIQWVVDIIEDCYKPMREGFNVDNKLSDLSDSKVDKDIMVCSVSFPVLVRLIIKYALIVLIGYLIDNFGYF